MIVYKGFNKDMTCRGFRFSEGESYHEEEAKLCDKGFHACEAPLDCFLYYSPATSVYHVCELDGVSDGKTDDTKVCGTDIKIGARLDIAGMVKAQIEWVQSKNEKPKRAHVRNGAASATGDYGAASATEDRGAASATGYRGAASATGKAAVAMTCGIDGKVSGALGCALFCVERGGWDGEKFPIVSVASGIVDGETLLPDVWYRCVNGKFEEVQNEQPPQ